MNRNQRRLSHQNGLRMQKKPWNEFKDVTLEAVQSHELFDKTSNFRPDQVFQNNKYIVQVFFHCMRDYKSYTKVMIRRSDSKPELSWSDMYRIKNEVFGEEIEAIQFIPKVSELVDVANLYWFWIENKECLK